ncbi:MAG: Bro-N domain-containing protein [Lachnospiraceae bacterium]|nr:Bro-N domain-containing protein [Lachnospiraceae bacterium]
MDEKEFESQLNQLKERVTKKEKNINTSIKLFEDRRVRTAWNEDEEQWYFSIVDVCQVLTDSIDGRKYWNKLKQRLKEEGNETVTNCHQLKLQASDGKMRLTDVANTAQLLRIIQSIPSPKAEPFKIWLATVGSDRLDEMADPEQAIDRALMYYKRKGYPDAWINQRLKTIEVRKDLTDEWQRSGINEGKEYAILTNELTQAWADMDTRQYKKYKNLKNENLRDNMSNIELILTMLAEASTTEISKAQNPVGLEKSKEVARKGGAVAKTARKDLERETGQPVITRKNAKDLHSLE